MVDLKRVVLVLIVITLILSAVSVVFNLMIYNMKSSDDGVKPSSKSGNLGLIVESNVQEAQNGNGG
mgnify:FL=1